MPLRPARRLPKSLRRPVSKETKRFVRRRHAKKRTLHDRFRKIFRRAEQSAAQWRKGIVRWLIIFFAALLLLCIGLFFFSSIATLRSVRIKEADPRLEVYQVREALEPFMNSHMLFLSKTEMTHAIEDAISDIESIDIEKLYPSEVHLKVALQPLIAKLTIVNPDEDLEAATSTGVHLDYLTDQGIYVQEENVESVDPLTSLTLVDWGVRPVVGTQLLHPDFLERISATERALHSLFAFTVSSRTVYLRAQEFHLNIGGKSLWFDVRSTLEEQLQRYRTFLRHVSMDEVEEYVDLRVSDRVIYK